MIPRAAELNQLARRTGLAIAMHHPPTATASAVVDNCRARGRVVSADTPPRTARIAASIEGHGLPPETA